MFASVLFGDVAVAGGESKRTTQAVKDSFSNSVKLSMKFANPLATGANFGK